MSEWKETDAKQSTDLFDVAIEMATGGFISRPTEHEITNAETGEEKVVGGNVGENIKRGNLRDS